MTTVALAPPSARRLGLDPVADDDRSPSAPREAAAPPGVTRRILLLVGVMCLMGLIDLLFTVTYVRSTGMYEMNPLARFILRHGELGHLVAFKLGSMAVSCLAIFAARRTRKAEYGAWACVFMLSVLMVHWVNYVNNMQALSYEFLLLMQNEELAGPAWVRIAD